MITRGKWVHEKFKDVFIDVTELLGESDEYIRLKVNWWNQGQTGIPFLLFQASPQIIRIKKEDFSKWSKYESKS